MAGDKSRPARPGAKPSKRTATSPPNAHLDHPLYVPRLDGLVLAAPERAGGVGYTEMLESICGITDDSQAVEQYDGTLGVPRSFVDAHERASVQVQWNDDLAAKYTAPGDVNGVRWGSGTMISPDLLLTCGHLFDQSPDGWTVPRQPGTNQPISPQDIALNMHVNFGYQVDATGTLRAEQRFVITQLVEYRLGGVDMAVCRIAGNPGSSFGWTAISPTNAAVAEMLVIIGHPAGQPKRIEAGPATQVSGGLIRYDDIDTLGGNSGSGILSGASGALVGIHTNGGCNAAGTGTNFGQAIEAVNAVSPTLQGLHVGTPFGADLHTKLSADIVGSRLSADIGTIRALDSHTVADVLGTRFGRDTAFSFDQGTGLARDTAIGGDLGTGLLGDVITGPGDDPRNTAREAIIDLGDIDPGMLFGTGGARPFVQAGPHVPIGTEDAVEADTMAVLGRVVLDLREAVGVQWAVLEQMETSLNALTEILGN